MEPLLLILVPGFLGGVLVALIVRRYGAAAADPGTAREPLRPVSTDTINMARIPVSGVGGLGLVAMAVTVALFVPRIRFSISVALGLGLALAILLILRRRRAGPLPSAGSPGAHGPLAIYNPEALSPPDTPPPDGHALVPVTGRI